MQLDLSSLKSCGSVSDSSNLNHFNHLLRRNSLKLWQIQKATASWQTMAAGLTWRTVKCALCIWPSLFWGAESIYSHVELDRIEQHFPIKLELDNIYPSKEEQRMDFLYSWIVLARLLHHDVFRLPTGTGSTTWLPSASTGCEEFWLAYFDCETLFFSKAKHHVLRCEPDT